MKQLLFTLLLITSITGIADAKVFPLVVKSSFTNDSWFPLPAEQMKAAAVDTALTKISSTKKFAFLYSSDIETTKPGSLDLAVTLVEPAESAKLTIRLSLPNNEGTFVSSSSVSLSNKNYKQIFIILQELGDAAADQLRLSINEVLINDVSDQQTDKIYNEIVSLNTNVINLHNEINNSAVETHNKAIYAKLEKLDTIITKLDQHHAYVKKSNELQNNKLDSIYNELQKLNIGSNTNNSLPDAKELSQFDIELLPIVNTAIELKYKKDFSGSENILSKVVSTDGISKLFKSAVEEELLINLPIYEADTKKTELSYSFMDQVKGDKYQQTVNRIRMLYESVLTRPDVLFEKRAEIKQKLDSLMISADSMTAVVKMMRQNELRNLKIMLQVSMQHRIMSGYGRKDGFCPNNDEISEVIRKSNLKILKLDSINEIDGWCDLLLTDDNSASEHIKFNFDEVLTPENNFSNTTSSSSQSNDHLGQPHTMLEQVLRNKIILLSNAINRYYKNNKFLPKLISDIKCRDPFNGMREIPCASAQKGDVFYINHNDDWVSIKSYLSDGEILKECKATIPINMYDRRYGTCSSLNVNSIPQS